MPYPTSFGTEWDKVPDSMVGKTVDLVSGGSREVTAPCLWSVGPTTYIIWPEKHGVGTS